MAKSTTKTNGKTNTVRRTAGRVRGPVQVTMAESLHPIIVDTMSITRCMATNEKDREKGQTMGTKHRIGYALYQFRVYVSPSDAQKSGFDASDLRLFENSLLHLFDEDRAARRELNIRKVFRALHTSKYGNVPAHEIFERITAELKPNVSSPTSFKDYDIKVNTEGLSVQLTDLTAAYGTLDDIGTNTFEPITSRVEYLVFFEVINSNPNGDPNADDRPRQDSISGLGLVTDVCLKRKIRKFVLESQKGVPHREIFFQEGQLLNDLISKPYDNDPVVKAAFEAKKAGDKSIDTDSMAQTVLCRQYFDVRAFGAVLSTGDKEDVTVQEETEAV
jgi:CRISPR/Cas system type I-B associated protein Csh2 (Cas7 group RAMP superfamily)